MKAAVMRHGELVVDDIADPHRGRARSWSRPLACGICGSDLHTLAHGDQMVEMATRRRRFPTTACRA